MRHFLVFFSYEFYKYIENDKEIGVCHHQMIIKNKTCPINEFIYKEFKKTIKNPYFRLKDLYITGIIELNNEDLNVWTEDLS